MFFEASGEKHPPALSMTVQSIVVPGGAASKTICREPWPAVMTPPERVQVQVGADVVGERSPTRPRRRPEPRWAP